MLGGDPYEAVLVRGLLRKRGERLERAVHRALEPDRRARALEDARGAGRHPLGDVDDAGRLGELAREGEERLRALGLAPLRLVEPRVLEGDGRVPGHDLEEPQVVRVELVEAELRDDDDAGHACAVLERDGEQRLLDLGGAVDLLAELVARGVSDEERAAGLGDAAGDSAADLRRQQLHRVARSRPREVAAEGDREEVVVVAEEDAAVVVVDEESELVGDRQPDLRDVVEARELPGEALEHLQVGDRAHVVSPDGLLRRTLTLALVERDDEALAARLRGHHRHLGARDELARVGGVLGPDGDAGRDGEPADGLGFELPELLADPLGERGRAADVAGGEDHRELLAADAADDVRPRTDARRTSATWCRSWSPMPCP